jgi:type IV secretion system protein TrbE
VLDEAWVYLRDELFREYLREWLKTLRKLNAAVVLATQNLSDIFNSGISDVVLEACPTKIFLANAEARNAQSRRLYETAGLNEREIEIVERATPKREYYVVSPEGRRLISLGLGQVALSFVGVNSPEERRRVDELVSAHPRTWPAEWLAERGRADWAEWWRESEASERKRVAR